MMVCIVWSREVKEKIWKEKWIEREDLLRKSWESETWSRQLRS